MSQISNKSAAFLVQILALSASFQTLAMDTPNHGEFSFSIEVFENVSGMKLNVIAQPPEVGELELALTSILNNPLAALEQHDQHQCHYQQNSESYDPLSRQYPLFLLNECHQLNCPNKRGHFAGQCPRFQAVSLMLKERQKQHQHKPLRVLSYAGGELFFETFFSILAEQNQMEITDFLITDPLYFALTYFIDCQKLSGKEFTVSSLGALIEQTDSNNKNKIKNDLRRLSQFLLALTALHPNANLYVFPYIRNANNMPQVDLVYAYDHDIIKETDREVEEYTAEMKTLEEKLKLGGMLFEFGGGKANDGFSFYARMFHNKSALAAAPGSVGSRSLFEWSLTGDSTQTKLYSNISESFLLCQLIRKKSDDTSGSASEL